VHKEKLRKEIEEDLEKIRDERRNEKKHTLGDGGGSEMGDDREDHGQYHGRKRYGEGGYGMGGLLISKRSLWLAAGGALGALAAIAIGKTSNKIKPAVVGAVKEAYAFKEWAAGKYEKAKEDAEDIVAEAKHAYHKDLEATAEAVKKEKKILKKVEETVEKKTRRMPKKEGGR